MRHPMKYILFAAILFFPISTIGAYACTCGVFRPPCEEYGSASAVFIGIVIGDSSISVQDGEYEFQKRLVSFAVEETFLGPQKTSAEVITGMGGGDCGVGFKRGERYLVYAYTNPQDNKLYTSICMRTRALSQAGEDLQYLRGLSSAPPGVRIYGEVQRYWSGVNAGRQPESMAGIKVSIDGTKKRVELMTDLKGRFSAGGLPGSVYKVKISLPQGLMSYSPEREIKVADRGCAMVLFDIVSDGRLSGRVLDFNGRPMPNVEIALCNSEEKMYRCKLSNAYSDKDGLYEFKAIPPGRYALGVWFDGLEIRNRPSQQIYYPGVDNIDQATIVTIDEGEKVEMNDLVLPPPRVEHSVEGVVEWPDGKPVQNAGIEYLPVNVPAGYGAKSDQEGRFSFKISDGLKIKIRARGEIEWGKYIYSDWVETSVMGEDVKVKIVLPVNQ
jgi:Carboxypeptidase regulatory-like domain